MFGSVPRMRTLAKLYKLQLQHTQSFNIQWLDFDDFSWSLEAMMTWFEGKVLEDRLLALNGETFMPYI